MRVVLFRSLKPVVFSENIFENICHFDHLEEVVTKHVLIMKTFLPTKIKMFQIIVKYIITTILVPQADKMLILWEENIQILMSYSD